MRDVAVGVVEVAVALSLGLGVGLIWKGLGVRPGWMASAVTLATVFSLVALRAVAS
jgi:hypothetical protein